MIGRSQDPPRKELQWQSKIKLTISTDPLSKLFLLNNRNAVQAGA